jgi:predicted metal-dependent hydrolase
VDVAELSPLPVRDLGFEFPDDLPVAWHPTIPELSFAANSISLLMPYVEPYFVRSVRAALPDLDEPLRTRTEAYIKQELAHHVQHRHFNDVLRAQAPGLRRVERWMQRTYRWLGRTRSRRFNIAFAAGSETIAFGIARWVSENLRVIFDGTDPEVERLFLWHLAEEVEHKTAAYDVFETTDGSRLRYTAATAISFCLLMVFNFASTAVMLRSTRRLHKPLAWFRLVRWSLSLAFCLLPILVVSCLPGHDPRSLVDPLYLMQWLKGAQGQADAA